MINIIYCSNSSEKVPNYWIKAFKKNGSFLITIIHQWQTRIKPNFIEKVFEKLKRPIDLTKYNKRIIKKSLILNADIIFIEKGWYVKPSTLYLIKKKIPKVKIIYFSNDNMKIFNNVVVNFNKCLNLNLYDQMYLINIESYKGLENSTKSKIFYIDKSYCTYSHKENFLRKKNIKKTIDISFIGSYEKERYEIMLFLANKGLVIEIFGYGWNRVKGHENLKINNFEVLGEKYIQKVLESKINLGFLRKANFDTHTSRSIEIFAIGGFMLIEYSKDHERIYGSNSSNILFKDKNELFDKIISFLKNYEDALRIKDAIQENIYEKKMSYDDKVRLIYDNYMKSLDY